MPKAIVIGGGIAGPTVAAFLTSIGWEAPVFEARVEPDPFEGLFLNVAVNGRRVLEVLGWNDRLLSDAHPSPSMAMWSGQGKRLGVVPNGPTGQPDAGGVVVRRGWLHEVVREGAEAAGVRVADGHRLVEVTQHKTGVTARFAGGHEEEGDLLIGADGVGSRVRQVVAPHVQPSFTGLVGAGGFARVPGLEPTPGLQHFVFGARSFFGYLVRDDRTVYWFANITASAPLDGDPAGRQDQDLLPRLRDLHQDDPAPVPEILARTTGPVVGYPIFRLPTVKPWWRDRTVLIGDAVHATSPSAGQGASMALEDAAVLAARLRDQPPAKSWAGAPDAPRLDRERIGRAFAAYESDRRERAEKLVAYAAKIDKQKRITTGRLGIAIRDALLPMFLRRAAGDHSSDWVFEFDPPWSA